MTTLYGIDHGMNWDWFAAIELNEDGTATVLWETRLHKFDPRQGSHCHEYWDRANCQYRIVEKPTNHCAGESRIAIGVTIDGQEYPLREPVGRWSFPHR